MKTNDLKRFDPQYCKSILYLNMFLLKQLKRTIQLRSTRKVSTLWG